MIWTCPVWEFAADTRRSNLMRLQNKVLRTIGNFPRRIPVCGFHMAGNHDYITKLCTQQAEVIQNRLNDLVRSVGQGEARHRKYMRLKLGCGQAYDCSNE
jgi:hypothetical protein